MLGPSNRLRSLRRRLIAGGEVEFQVLSVDGLPCRNPQLLGTFSTLPEALQRARRCAATSVVVREWAFDPQDPVLRVHVSTQEWLLLWQRVCVFADSGVRGAKRPPRIAVNDCLPISGAKRRFKAF